MTSTNVSSGTRSDDTGSENTGSGNTRSGSSNQQIFRMRLGQDGNWHTVQTNEDGTETGETAANQNHPVINSGGGVTVRSLSMTSSGNTVTS